MHEIDEITNLCKRFKWCTSSALMPTTVFSRARQCFSSVFLYSFWFFIPFPILSPSSLYIFCCLLSFFLPRSFPRSTLTLNEENQFKRKLNRLKSRATFRLKFISTECIWAAPQYLDERGREIVCERERESENARAYFYGSPPMEFDAISNTLYAIT